MKAAIMQPTYMAWLGYFSMIDKVDIFVFLDDVQIVKRSWQVRNKIKQNDKELMLTIPIIKNKNRKDMLINNTRYNEIDNWKEKHLISIKHSYSKAKYFREIYPFIEGIYSYDYDSIGNFNIKIIQEICKEIGINTKLLLSSELKKEEGHKDGLLVNICESVNASSYLSAQGSAQYIEKDNPGGEFTKRGIELYYQQYRHPTYFQLGKDFISHIGIYDLLFNEGFDNALDIIRSGSSVDIYYKDFREKYMNFIEGGDNNEDI